MNFETYQKRGATQYRLLAQEVADILTAAIKTHSIPYRLQQVQFREKSPESLHRKLENLSLLDSLQIEEIVKDLAGCRVIFYTNSDVSEFVGSGIISDNFDVDWDRTKFHYPDPGANAATALFKSHNYVVRLNDKRALLPEYEQFRGMLCEIQVQTLLDHAWSETAHDTIYKKPHLAGFGGALMDSIEHRMASIMKDYLMPAGHEFQKVADDFERLVSGKQLFDGSVLNQLQSCEDNEQLYDLVTRLQADVIPNYDDIQSVHSDIRRTVVDAVVRSRDRPPKDIDTPSGTLPGKTTKQLLAVACGIIDQLRYINEESVEQSFDALCQLYSWSSNDDERPAKGDAIGARLGGA